MKAKDQNPKMDNQLPKQKRPAKRPVERRTRITSRHEVVGPDHCCAWWSGPREIKVQFLDYDLCRKFSKSKFNCYLDGYGVAGGFLRIILVKGKTLNWFVRWLARNDQPKKLSEGYGGKSPIRLPKSSEITHQPITPRKSL